MAIRDSIVEARKRKADDRAILAKIYEQNPEKQAVIQTALERGASPSAVVDEILKQNGGVPKPRAIDRFAKGFRGEGTITGEFLQTGSEVLKGAMKGAASTLRGASMLGEKLIRSVLPKALEPKYEDTTAAEQLVPNEMVTPKNAAQKVGFVAEQIAEFLVPAGKIVQVEKMGIAGTSAAAKAAGLGKVGALVGKELVRAGVGALSSGAIIAVQSGGDKKEIRKAMIVGAAVPVALDAVVGIGKVAGQVAKWFGSKLSGVPERAIDQAFHKPDKVRAAIRAAAEKDNEAAFKVYNDAVDSFDELKALRRTAYREALKNIKGSIWTTKNGQIYIKNADDVWVPTDLGLKGVKDTITKTLKDYGASGARNSFDFTKTPLPKNYQTQLGEMVDRVYAWDDFTPTGLDDLREIIGSYEKSSVAIGQAGKADRIFNAIIGDVKKNLASYVGEKMPAISAMNREYAVQSEFIDDVLRYLKLESPDKSTAIRRLIDVFNPRSQVYAKYLTELGEKTGTDLMADMAGVLMSRWIPDKGLGQIVTSLITGGAGVAAFTNPGALLAIPPTLAGSSPRVVGEIATRLGQMSANPSIRLLLERLTPATTGAVNVLKRGK